MAALIDLHNDAITSLTAKRFKKYIKNAEKIGITSVFTSIWTTDMQDPLELIKKYKHLLDHMDVGVELLLHIEDAWFVNYDNIDELLAHRPDSIGLTWNMNNSLAGGANADGGLTPLGEHFIERLVCDDIIVDLAHLNTKSFYQVAEMLRKHNRPLLCSHTCFDAINTHPRNLDCRQVKTIVASDGLVGLTLVGEFLTTNKSATMHDVYNHVKYFIDTFGDDNLAIGTDFFGIEKRNLPKGLRRYKDFRRFRKFLLDQGLDIQTIEKIFWRNANRFLGSYNKI